MFVAFGVSYIITEQRNSSRVGRAKKQGGFSVSEYDKNTEAQPGASWALRAPKPHESFVLELAAVSTRTHPRETRTCTRGYG